MKPIILAGGIGSRLWPKSRAALPKQFLSLASQNTMLQETVIRLPEYKVKPPIIVCNEKHRFLAAEQLKTASIDYDKIILEPFGRNTAAAIALAALREIDSGKDSTLLVLSADHSIENTEAFHAALSKGEILANSNKLVTFGVPPRHPHTDYGYIKCGKKIDSYGFEVDKFFEKPNTSKANEFYKSEQYYWNSGIFMFKASVYLNELKSYRPKIYEHCHEAMSQTKQDLSFLRIDSDAFQKCPSESIDCAVMENTKSACVVPMDADWNDVGSWESLWETSKTKDQDGNVCVGDVIMTNSHNNYVNSEGRLISVIGLNDIVVIETKDAVLVAQKDKVQDIKLVVDQLKSEKRQEYEFHREVFRPWGSYDSIDQGKRYQVKRIKVSPGEKLSVQMHHHRAEHWIVVSGTASVTIGDTTKLVSENESVYIPVGEIHALENPGQITLELIEVQSGSYLGEDDIVRFSDRYGRK